MKSGWLIGIWLFQRMKSQDLVLQLRVTEEPNRLAAASRLHERWVSPWYWRLSRIDVISWCAWTRDEEFDESLSQLINQWSLPSTVTKVWSWSSSSIVITITFIVHGYRENGNITNTIRYACNVRLDHFHLAQDAANAAHWAKQLIHQLNGPQKQCLYNRIVNF